LRKGVPSQEKGGNRKQAQRGDRTVGKTQRGGVKKLSGIKGCVFVFASVGGEAGVPRGRNPVPEGSGKAGLVLDLPRWRKPRKCPQQLALKKKATIVNLKKSLPGPKRKGPKNAKKCQGTVRELGRQKKTEKGMVPATGEGCENRDKPIKNGGQSKENGWARISRITTTTGRREDRTKETGIAYAQTSGSSNAQPRCKEGTELKNPEWTPAGKPHKRA